METTEILSRLEKVREARMEIGVEIALYRDFLRWVGYEADDGDFVWGHRSWCGGCEKAIIEDDGEAPCTVQERARTLLEGIRTIEEGR